MAFQTIRRTPYGCILLQRAKNGEHALIVSPSSAKHRDLYGGVVFHTVGSDLPYDADMMASDLIHACKGTHTHILSHAMRQRIDPVPSAEYR